jgi:hypothetical protein
MKKIRENGGWFQKCQNQKDESQRSLNIPLGNILECGITKYPPPPYCGLFPLVVMIRIIAALSNLYTIELRQGSQASHLLLPPSVKIQKIDHTVNLNYTINLFKNVVFILGKSLLCALSLKIPFSCLRAGQLYCISCFPAIIAITVFHVSPLSLQQLYFMFPRDICNNCISVR